MIKMKGGNIKLAVIAQEVYDEPSKRTGRDGWKYESGDKRHGIWSKNNKAVVGIRGTDFKDAKDLADDVAIGIGALKLTPRYRRAKRWVKKAIKKYGKSNVEVSGHSLGGKIAKELAKEFGIRGSTFNAGASVSDAASSILDRTACKVNKKGKRCQRAKKVENYRTAIDPVSAAAVADINTTTVKRKKGKDPHAIANFVPEGSEQEGEGFRDRMRDRYGYFKTMRKLQRRRIPLAEIASTPMHVRTILSEAVGGEENIPPDAPATFPSLISLIEYAVRQKDLRRGAEGMPPLEQVGEEQEEQEGGYYGMRGRGDTDEEATEDDVLEEEDDEEMENRAIRQVGVEARQFFMKINREGENYYEFWEAKIAPTLSKEQKERAKNIILNSYTNAYVKYAGDEEKEENILKEARENADKRLVSEGLMLAYFATGMYGRGMCGGRLKRYDFTQVGTGRRMMKKSKNMVEEAPPPQKKKKVLSQKEYCSLYRC